MIISTRQLVIPREHHNYFNSDKRFHVNDSGVYPYSMTERTSLSEVIKRIREVKGKSSISNLEIEIEVPKDYNYNSDLSGIAHTTRDGNFGEGLIIVIKVADL